MSAAPNEAEGLERTIAEAERQAHAHEAEAAQIARRQAEAPRRRARARAGLGALLALGIGAAGWTATRVPAPDTAELDRGRPLVLALAGQAVVDQYRATGRVPADLAAALPVAASVRIEPVAGGVRLSLTAPDGRVQTLTVPLAAAAGAR